ncbi:MAG: hypothetical protein ACRDU8_08190 [Egibacteraceae bacterium]
MLRRTAVTMTSAGVAALLFAVLTPAPAVAQGEPPPDVEHTDDGMAASIDDGDDRGPTQPPATPARGHSSDGSIQPVGYYHWDVEVHNAGENGEECWQVVAQLSDTAPDEYSTRQSAEEMADSFDNNGTLYDRCPPELAPVFDPGALAQQLWAEAVQFPQPQPEVKPGEALTGLPAYLEIDGDDAPEWSFDTPVGTQIVLSATPRYEITWGDGSPDTETEKSGEPYPGGPQEITHLYLDAARNQIEVRAYWTGQWSLAGMGGGNLGENPNPSIGSFDLPVGEVQAVRER